MKMKWLLGLVTFLFLVSACGFISGKEELTMSGGSEKPKELLPADAEDGN